MSSPLGQRLAIDTLAPALLTIVEDHFAAASVELPERRYVAAGDPGQIAWDCAQLVVSLRGIGWGPAEDAAPPSPQIAQMTVFGVRHAVFSISLIRCTPTQPARGSAFPSVEDIHEAGIAFMKDAGLLSQSLVAAASNLHVDLPEGSDVQAGVITPLGPTGGFHGMEAIFSVTSADLT